MEIRRFHHQGLGSYSYLLVEQKSRTAIAIDPIRLVDPILTAASNAQVDIVAAFETHLHADYLSGVQELKTHFPALKIHFSAAGGERWTTKSCDEAIGQGFSYQLGAHRLVARHTPGHTPEHLIYELWDQEEVTHLFTGDLLFVGSVGRPDILGEAEQKKLGLKLYHSLQKIICEYPDHVQVYPSHGAGSLCGKALGGLPSSTIGFEKAHNTYLTPGPENAWVEGLLENMPPAPPYFAEMKKRNLGVIKPRVECSPQNPHLSAFPESSFYIDVRPGEQFVAGHKKGALHLPLGPMLVRSAGWLLTGEERIVIFCERETQYEEALAELQLIGIEDVLGYQLITEVDSKEAFPLLNSMQLAAKLHGKEVEVLDVRSEAEFSSGSIPGAKRMSLLALSGYTPVSSAVVVCSKGVRSLIAGSFLASKSSQPVYSLEGGMEAWKKNLMPIA